MFKTEAQQNRCEHEKKANHEENQPNTATTERDSLSKKDPVVDFIAIQDYRGAGHLFLEEIVCSKAQQYEFFSRMGQEDLSQIILPEMFVQQQRNFLDLQFSQAPEVNMISSSQEKPENRSKDNDFLFSDSMHEEHDSDLPYNSSSDESNDSYSEQNFTEKQFSRISKTDLAERNLAKILPQKMRGANIPKGIKRQVLLSIKKKYIQEKNISAYQEQLSSLEYSKTASINSLTNLLKDKTNRDLLRERLGYRLATEVTTNSQNCHKLLYMIYLKAYRFRCHSEQLMGRIQVPRKKKNISKQR